jgi:hypothetical protein
MRWDMQQKGERREKDDPSRGLNHVPPAIWTVVLNQVD